MMGGSLSWQIYEAEFSRAISGPPPREIEFRRMILEAIIDQQFYYGAAFDPSKTRSALELQADLPEVTLIGWMDSAPPEILVNGEAPQESATGVYLAHLPIDLSETSEIHLPPGMLPGLIAEMPFSAGSCGPDTTSIWLEKGEAVLEFVLFPSFMDLDIEALELSFQADTGWAGLPNLAIYNWETETWNSLANLAIGTNTIPNPDENISPEGLVRFQLETNTQEGRGGGCYFFGLGLKGQH
jgi:hypothetical protein